MHMRGTCYNPFYLENLICTLWSVKISLSLFSLTVFTSLFRDSAQTFTENPAGVQIWSPDNSPISPTVSFHTSFSLNLCVYIYIYIDAYKFVFLLNFIYIYSWIWSWRSVWVWRKPHELWIFSLRFCRFNELMAISFSLVYELRF